MSEIARALLLKLLAQADRGGRATLPINDRSASDYFAVAGLDERDRIHAFLANAEMAGGITLERGRGAEVQDIKRLRIKDADRLAEWLCVPRSTEHAARIEQRLTDPLADAPAWLRDAYGRAVKQWRLGRSAFRIAPSDTEAATNLFRVALAVAFGEQIGHDLRSFSVRLLGDSKAVERLLSRLAGLLRCNPEWGELEDSTELFRTLGLEKFPPPLLARGPLRIDYGGVDWDVSVLRPFVGLSPDHVRKLAPIRPVAYVLTVENLASFQRHVREIDDDGIVIYTAGFPAPSLIQILERLDRCLPAECSFFHWGDRDVGGLRIFARLASPLSNHRLHPHLMAEIVDGEIAFTVKELRQLERLKGETDTVAMMVRSWLEKKLGKMEQEMTDPRRPV
jgi:hypothetical protein